MEPSLLICILTPSIYFICSYNGKLRLWVVSLRANAARVARELVVQGCTVGFKSQNFHRYITNSCMLQLVTLLSVYYFISLVRAQ